MRRPEDFQDGKVCLIMKLGDTNPARLLVKRRLFVTQPTLTELKSWLRTVASIDFWVFNVWPVVAGLFVNG